MFLSFRDFHSHDLFVLPDHVMLKVVSLLLSGAAIDRDEHKVDHVILLAWYCFLNKGRWSLF